MDRRTTNKATPSKKTKPFVHEKKVSIVGAPTRFGQPKGGVEEGPKAIREAGLIPQLEELGFEVHDKGDIRFEYLENDEAINNVKRARQTGQACHRIYEEVYKCASSGELCVTLGGDHSLAIGSIAGIAKAWKDLCIIWVDAHADINTPETSPSGNIHGMPVGFLSGLVKERIQPFEWMESSYITPQDVVYIGLRDVDSGERALLKEHGVKCFSMSDVDRLGIVSVMEQALDHVNPNRDRPIHLSYDVDGNDPSVCPATGTAVMGGLSYREARYICETVHDTGLLVGMDVAEVNPSLAATPKEAHITATVAVDLVRFALGYKLL